MPTSSTPSTPLSPRQREALLTLLADDDPVIAETARRRLLAEGPGLIAWLRPHSLSSNPIVRRRAREILHHFAAEEADVRMVAFCARAGEDLDLEEGVLRLAQTRHPEINPEAYRAVLDEWAAQVAEWLPAERTDDDGVLAGVQTVLFQQLGLKGNAENYYDPDNSYLNRVIDRRLGNPISLCTIVLLIARRLGLPFAGIGLPTHFLCRYQSAARQLYLDAFHGGRLLARVDCIAFVNQLGRPFDETFLQPVSPRRMLQRMCVNLEHAFEALELRSELGRVHRYHQLLADG